MFLRALQDGTNDNNDKSHILISNALLGYFSMIWILHGANNKSKTEGLYEDVFN